MAVFPVAAGHPDLTGTYIPQIFAQKLLKVFYPSLVMSEIANTDYEGQIKKFGDTVTIRTVPTMTIRSYEKHMDLVHETPEPETIDLLIDKGLYWAFKVDKVDIKQSDIPMVSTWSADAAQRLKIQQETAVFADIYNDTHASNTGIAAGVKSGDINLGVAGTPLAVSKTNIIDTIVDAEVVLNEQNVPLEGRWMILPNWAIGMIKKSDLQDASLSGDGQSLLRTGRIGRIASFNIYASNLLLAGADAGAVNALFGQKSALTFATQMTESEMIPNPKSFGKLIRGLNVYGYKVIKPEALGLLYIVKG